MIPPFLSESEKSYFDVEIFFCYGMYGIVRTFLEILWFSQSNHEKISYYVQGIPEYNYFKDISFIGG